MVYEQRYQCPCVQKNRSHSLPLVKGIRSRHRWRFYLQPLENDAETCDTQEMMETYISIYFKELHCPDWKGGLIALSVQFSSFQSLSRVRLCATPWIAAHQASLSITNSQSLPKLMSIESVMPPSQLILCHPLLLLPPIPPSIRVFSNESTLHQVAKVLEFHLQHQSFQWTPRTDLI